MNRACWWIDKATKCLIFASSMLNKLTVGKIDDLDVPVRVFFVETLNVGPHPKPSSATRSPAFGDGRNRSRDRRHRNDRGRVRVVLFLRLFRRCWWGDLKNDIQTIRIKKRRLTCTVFLKGILITTKTYNYFYRQNIVQVLCFSKIMSKCVENQTKWFCFKFIECMKNCHVFCGSCVSD